MEKRFVQTDKREYVKDMQTKAILNTDNDALLAYKKNKDRVVRLKNLEEKVSNFDAIENRLKELEILIHKIIKE